MGAIVASDSTINEHIDGHLAFWSLTGNPNDWHIIPEFSTGTPGLLFGLPLPRHMEP